MQRAFGFAAGKVVWTGSGESKSGRAFTIVQIEMAGRPYGDQGKVYHNRVTCHDYASKEQIAKGDFVSVGGECEPKVEERNGKSYAVLIITGRVQRMDIPVMPAPTAEGSADEPA